MAYEYHFCALWHIFVVWFMRWDKTRSNSSGFLFLIKIGRKRVLGSLDHRFFFGSVRTERELNSFIFARTNCWMLSLFRVKMMLLLWIVGSGIRIDSPVFSLPFQFTKLIGEGRRNFRDGNMWVFYLISLPLTLGMVIVTLRYFAGPWVPRYVFLTVGYTWFCSLSIIILVPADIWTVCFWSIVSCWLGSSDAVVCSIGRYFVIIHVDAFDMSLQLVWWGFNLPLKGDLGISSGD